MQLVSPSSPLPLHAFHHGLLAIISDPLKNTRVLLSLVSRSTTSRTPDMAQSPLLSGLPHAKPHRQPEAGAFGTSYRRPACYRACRIVAAALPDDSQEAQRPLPAQRDFASFHADNQPPKLVGDWRSFRAQLVALERLSSAGGAAELLTRSSSRWAHEIAQPEKGCLLVAKRKGLGMFASAVILMLEHDDTQGSSGLLINYPTSLLISSLGLEEEISDAFGKSPLFIGGPVTKNLLHVLHGRRDVEGSLEIMDGVYAGGVESASELVRSRRAAPQEFKLLAGYSGWGPWQLHAELEAGTWWAVAASQELILEILTDSYCRREMGGSPHAEALKRQCWEKVLRTAGIEFEHMGL